MKINKGDVVRVRFSTFQGKYPLVGEVMGIIMDGTHELFRVRVGNNHGDWWLSGKFIRLPKDGE